MQDEFDYGKSWLENNVFEQTYLPFIINYLSKSQEDNIYLFSSRKKLMFMKEMFEHKSLILNVPNIIPTTIDNRGLNTDYWMVFYNIKDYKDKFLKTFEVLKSYSRLLIIQNGEKINIKLYDNKLYYVTKSFSYDTIERALFLVLNKKYNQLPIEDK